MSKFLHDDDNDDANAIEIPRANERKNNEMKKERN